MLGKTGCNIACLLPYCTHKLQFAVSEDIPHTGDKNLAPKPSRVVTHYQITGLVGRAYLKLATAAIAGNGFRRTGLFPCNRHIFNEHDPGKISEQHHELFA